MARKINNKCDYLRLNKNYLRALVIGCFDVDAPDTVDKHYLLSNILFHAYCGIFKYNGDIVASRGTLSGIGRYYRPVNFTTNEPFFNGVKQLTIGENCEIVYNSRFYINPDENRLNLLVDTYAHRLTEIDISMDTSIINSRVCLIPVVNDEKDAVRTREILDKMYDGEPNALSFKTSLGQKNYDILPIKTRDAIVTDVIADARNTVINEFLAHIGVDFLAVDKKERTNYAELSTNDERLEISFNEILEPIKNGFERVNALFGTNFSIKKREFLKKGVNDNANETLPEDN